MGNSEDNGVWYTLEIRFPQSPHKTNRPTSPTLLRNTYIITLLDII